MSKFLVLLMLLTACSGGGSSFGPGGPVGAGGGDGLSSPQMPGGGTVGGQASGDGLLGSQSASTDIGISFYRSHALDFDPDPEPSAALIELPMTSAAQAFGTGEVRKIAGSDGKGLVLSATAVHSQALVAIGSWVRAVYCGNFPDSEIEALIPADEKDKPWASDRLFWFVVNLPREGFAHRVECLAPTYRDFKVDAESKADLSSLEGGHQDLFFFALLGSGDFAGLGPLSEEETPLSSEQWLALSKRPKLRIVRLKPAGSIGRVIAIPTHMVEMH